MTTVQNGLRLEIWVPRSVYPRDALVPVDVKLTNLGRKGIVVELPAICYGGKNPIAAALSPAGVPQPVLHEPPGAAGCGEGRDVDVDAGKSHSEHVLVVAQTNRLAPLYLLSEYGPLFRGRPAVLRLTPAQPPRVKFGGGSRPYADVLPHGGWRGLLRYQERAVCATRAGLAHAGREVWLTAGGHRLRPQWPVGCVTNRVWSFVAGWEGQSAVRVTRRVP